MKDKQKVWIRGVEGRGDEVLKVLTDLGADKCTFLDGNDSGSIYFIGHDGKMHYYLRSCEAAKVIMEEYKEIKLSERWMDGDILKCRNLDNDYVVFKSYLDPEKQFFNVYLHNSDIFCSLLRYTVEDYRLATNEEVDQFYRFLHKNKKNWDSKNKKLVDWRWKPSNGDTIYYVDPYFIVRRSRWSDNKEYCNSLYNAHNCFRTVDEANDVSIKFKKITQ